MHTHVLLARSVSASACVCVRFDEPGGSEGGVKCYSFSSFHVTEKCLCQNLQRRERVFSQGLLSGDKREKEERGRLKQPMVKVSFPPLHHCLSPACSLLSSIFFFNNLQPEAAWSQGEELPPAEARQRPSSGLMGWGSHWETVLQKLQPDGFFGPGVASIFSNTSSVFASWHCSISLELPLLPLTKYTNTHTHTFLQVCFCWQSSPQNCRTVAW